MPEFIAPPIHIRNPATGQAVGPEMEFWYGDIETLNARNFDGIVDPDGDDYAYVIDGASPEMMQSMGETQPRAPVHSQDVPGIVTAVRNRFAEGAEVCGLFVVATSTALQAPPEGHAFTRTQRISAFRESLGEDRMQEASTAGAHVHVSVLDESGSTRELATEVTNRVRPWVNVLSAFTVNSPIRHGHYGGLASQRMVRWSTLDSYRETHPYAESWDDFVRIASEAIAARGEDGNDLTRAHDTVRPHLKYNTVEIRTNDVGLTPDDDILGAYLAQALVHRTAQDVLAGRPPVYSLPDPESFYPLARKLVAKNGLNGPLLDPETGRVARSRIVVDKFIAYITPALHELGTHDAAKTLLDGVRGVGPQRGIGTGAERQLVAWAANSFAREKAGLPFADRKQFLRGQVDLVPDEARDLMLFAGIQTVNGQLSGPDAGRLVPLTRYHQVDRLLDKHPDRASRLLTADVEMARSFLVSQRVIAPAPGIDAGRSARAQVPALGLG